jgi:diguanylate cyclase (GGDEF)-like protein
LVGLIVASIFVVMLFTRLIRASRILRAQKSEAQYMANHDMLTGLPNRRVLSMRLDAGSANHAADDHRIILATLDLDRFKEINDTLGHHAGDELLAGVAMRLRSTLPPSDLLVRLGGDEFAVLCDDGSETSETDLGALIQAALRKPLSLGGHQIDVQISVGIASAKTPQGYAQLMQSSDIALYDAKSRGPGQIGYFVPSMAQRLDDRRAMKVEMRKAFTNGEFILHYQPIVEASTGKVAAVEALLRWSNEKFGQVSPEIFVPLAEECGMMAALGQFVIDRAVADSRSWPNFKTAINISPAQIRSVSIVSDIIRSIKRHKVDPRNIIVEVTETALLGNDRRTLKKLNMLKDRGFGLALDDFGTGYSSLAYIRDFPFDRLKIDKSFIRSSENSPRSLEIIQGIVNFGKILGREVVAEGIETETQMQTMQRAGVTHLQGFLFAKALDATTIEVLAAAGGVIPSRRTTRLELGDREPTKAPPIALPAPRQMPRS